MKVCKLKQEAIQKKKCVKIWKPAKYRATTVWLLLLINNSYLGVAILESCLLPLCSKRVLYDIQHTLAETAVLEVILVKILVGSWRISSQVQPFFFHEVFKTPRLPGKARATEEGQGQQTQKHTLERLQSLATNWTVPAQESSCGPAPLAPIIAWYSGWDTSSNTLVFALKTDKHSSNNCRAKGSL